MFYLGEALATVSLRFCLRWIVAPIIGAVALACSIALAMGIIWLAVKYGWAWPWALAVLLSIFLGRLIVWGLTGQN